MGAQIALGNVSPIDYITDPETGAKQLHRWEGITKTETVMNLVEEDLLAQLRDAVNLWNQLSDQPPAWVEGDSEGLIAALRQQYGCGARPEDWEAEIDNPTLVAVEAEPAAVPSDDAAEVTA